MSIEVVDRFHADQYTGGNGSALTTTLNGTVVSDDGTTLVFQGPGFITYTLAAGEWAIWYENPSPVIVTAPVGAGTMPLRYTNLASKILSVAPTGTGTGTLVQSSGGGVAVPASLLGQTANYDVTVSPALPTTGYKPLAHLRGAPGIVSGHSILNVTALSTTVVRVQVQSAAASLVGATVHANAFALV